MAGQGRQEQVPVAGTHLQGEYLPQHSLREVGQGQAQAGGPRGPNQGAQGFFQGPKRSLPSRCLPLAGFLVMAERGRPHLALGVERIPKAQGVQRAAQGRADGSQQAWGLLGAEWSTC